MIFNAINGDWNKSIKCFKSEDLTTSRLTHTVIENLDGER